MAKTRDQAKAGSAQPVKGRQVNHETSVQHTRGLFLFPQSRSRRDLYDGRAVRNGTRGTWPDPGPLRGANERPSESLGLLHPRPARWSSILAICSACKGFGGKRFSPQRFSSQTVCVSVRVRMRTPCSLPRLPQSRSLERLKTCASACMY